MPRFRRLVAVIGMSLAGYSLLIGSVCLAATNVSDTFQNGPSSAASEAQDKESESSQEVSQEYLEWQDAECRDCHEDENKSYQEDGTLVYQHQNVACIECHTDQGLGGLHKDVDEDSRTPRRLKETTVDETSCLACHEKDNLAEATKQLEILVDSEGTVVNPHDMPDVEGHEDITCTSCHLAHESSEPDNEAKLLCLGCHHMNVYECNTCHSA